MTHGDAFSHMSLSRARAAAFYGNLHHLRHHRPEGSRPRPEPGLEPTRAFEVSKDGWPAPHATGSAGHGRCRWAAAAKATHLHRRPEARTQARAVTAHLGQCRSIAISPWQAATALSIRGQRLGQLSLCSAPQRPSVSRFCVNAIKDAYPNAEFSVRRLQNRRSL